MRYDGDIATVVGADLQMLKEHHVALLNAGVDSWNRLREERPFLPLLSRIVVEGDGQSNWLPALESNRLSVTQQDLRRVNLSDADLRGAILDGGVFRGADFSGADLKGASCRWSNMRGADLRGARLEGFVAVGANFLNAKFGDKILEDFDGYPYGIQPTDLTRVDLSYSDLFLASLADADLSRAKLDGSKLWRARLLKPPQLDTDLASGKPFRIKRIQSLSGLEGLRRHLLHVYSSDLDAGRVEFYFRGEPCDRAQLRPTAMRRGLRQFERELLVRLETESPATFSGCEYAIDELAIARHFELPSRLLDVTRNPLVALYWATDAAEVQHRGFGCEEVECTRDCSCVHPAEPCEGKLHVFAMPTDLVRAYDSDRISIVANFARLSMLQQERLLTKRAEDVDGIDYEAWESPRNSMKESKKTLHHYIQSEKPYFTDDIDIRDMFRVFVVEPRRSFDRITAQSGAFMLSAFHERFEGDEVAKRLANTKMYNHHVVAVPAGKKKQELRQELDWLGFNKQTLYADVESKVAAVTERFLKRAAR